MGTNTAAAPGAQLYHTAQIHYLRKDFTFANTTAVPLHVGVVPAGSVILKALSGVDVQVAFTAATNHRMDIGTPANDDLYGTDLALETIAFVPLDEAVTFKVAVDTTIIATPDLTGATNTAGEGTVIIAYIPDLGAPASNVT